MEEKTRKAFIDYFRLLAAPSSSAAEVRGLHNLGCEVDSSLLLSLWFDEIWDFSLPPPLLRQTFVPSELEMLENFNQFLLENKPNLQHCRSFDEVAVNPSWQVVTSKAREMLTLVKTKG